jgi:transmembrane sensor
MDLKKFKETLKRYEQRTSNETEDALVEAWYKSYEHSEQRISDEELSIMRDPLFRRIQSATQFKPALRFSVLQIAASITIFLLAGLGIFYNFYKPAAANFVSISAADNAPKKVSLPDGSVVWLNAGSNIKMPVSFAGSTRDVVLTEGEAFFEIQKDRMHPFIVHTSKLTVQVLGTSFNIKAYKAISLIRVNVATGKVAVKEGAKVLAMLTPGQQLEYNLSDRSVIVTETDKSEAQGWKEGATSLNQVTFQELAVAVKNIYGLSIKAKNNKISAYHFSMKLLHNLPEQQVLELIGQLHHTPFRKEGKDVIFY